MGKNQTVIELNGIRYDAVTGRVIQPAANTKSSAPRMADSRPPTKTVRHTPDGFVRKAPAKPARRSAQASKTLMRTAVRKPQPKQATAAAAHATALNHPTIKRHARSDGMIAGHADPIRLGRAGHIKQSRLVSKFGGTMKKAVPMVTAVLPVRQAPPEVSPPVIPSHEPSAKLASKVEKALNSATSHHSRPLPKSKLSHRVSRKLRLSPRALNIAGFGFALLLIGGLVFYQNSSNLSMKVAAARSGVDGTLPAYQPAGFGEKGNIRYTSGQIVVTYHSHTDARTYDVIQRSSTWNSDALLDNFVASEKRAFQVRQDNGKTIYLYDGNNATWVDGGIWYQVNGKASLSSDQLLRIVDSL